MTGIGRPPVTERASGGMGIQVRPIMRGHSQSRSSSEPEPGLSRIDLHIENRGQAGGIWIVEGVTPRAANETDLFGDLSDQRKLDLLAGVDAATRQGPVLVAVVSTALSPSSLLDHEDAVAPSDDRCYSAAFHTPSSQIPSDAVRWRRATARDQPALASCPVPCEWLRTAPSLDAAR
jgi:hypothetical protein